MSLVMRKIKLYAKLTFLVALALIVALVVFNNRKHQVTVWFFGTYESINVLWLMLCTAGGALVSGWVLWTSFSVWRDLRDAFKESEAKREKQEIDQRARELQEAERRIDQKLKDAVERSDNA